ncbi:MAG: PrsW family intramembrane metalloprotease [Chloroflexi bacterium]|nr:PrsW family intramembrane metalloprotease [Chloroflexota bacterium]
MTITRPKPSKFWAYVVLIAGGILLFSGVAAAIGYFGLPFTTVMEDILTPQLGQMAAIFLGLVGGGLAVYHGLGSVFNRPSSVLKLPPFYLFWIVFAVVLGLGNVLLNFHVVEELFFPPLFLLGAALPTVAVLAWAGRHLNWPATWRQGALSLVSGSTLSIMVTILLGSVLPLLVYLLIEPLADALYYFWRVPNFLFSPDVLFFIFFTAIQAPIPEEFAKALGPGLMVHRLKSERQAFFVGLASGAGFAILENMLYEGLYAQWNGWAWGGITLLRGFGSVLHPLGTGIIALALFRARGRPPGWFGRLARAYLISVGLHTLWNGGFSLFTYFTGISLYGGVRLDFNGQAISVSLIVFLIAFSSGLWWLLRKIVRDLAVPVDQVAAEAAPLPEVSPRALAVWALVSALVIVPIGAALGPAWEQIRAVILMQVP